MRAVFPLAAISAACRASLNVCLCVCVCVCVCVCTHTQLCEKNLIAADWTIDDDPSFFFIRSLRRLQRSQRKLSFQRSTNTKASDLQLAITRRPLLGSYADSRDLRDSRHPPMMPEIRTIRTELRIVFLFCFFLFLTEEKKAPDLQLAITGF